jgi:hypothetical protein
MAVRSPNRRHGAMLDFLESVRGQAETLRLDRSDGQPVRLIVMCEAAGKAVGPSLC